MMYSALISSSCRVLASPRLKRMGFLSVAELLEQLEVLHVARADLDHVHILKQRQVAEPSMISVTIGQAGYALAPPTSSSMPSRAQSLEGIGRGARLERAAAQQRRARGLHRLGHRR